jgi:hypothetical protein
MKTTHDRLLSLLEQYAASGQASMLQLMMLAGVNPNLKGKDGKTIAHHAALYAVATGDAAVIRKIADYGGAMYARDARGVAPMDILKAKPKLYEEVQRAVLKGVGNAGVKDSNTVKGDSCLSEKAKKHRKTIRKLRGGAKALLRPADKSKEREKEGFGVKTQSEEEVLVIHPLKR